MFINFKFNLDSLFHLSSDTNIAFHGMFFVLTILFTTAIHLCFLRLHKQIMEIGGAKLKTQQVSLSYKTVYCVWGWFTVLEEHAELYGINV